MRVIIKRPILTEKTYKLANDNNQYTFEVSNDADKKQVARAIEDKFNVEVKDVKIINILGKTKRFGAARKAGKRSDIKKAVVTLNPKQSIDLFEIK